LQEAKTIGGLASRFEVDALPEAGRTYDRIADDGQGEEQQDGDKNKDKDEQKAAATPARPLPELFAKRGGQGSSIDGSAGAKPDEKPDKDADSDEKSNTKKGFFARMFGR
jgi:hypothetical protein